MADVIIQDLDAAAAATADQLFEITDDPGGTPNSQKLTVAQLQTFLETYSGSSGRISGGVISDAGSQTYDVALGTGFFRSTDSENGDNYYLGWSVSSANAIADGETKYVFVDYNAGTPIVTIKGAYSSDRHTEFYLGSVVRVGTTLHVFNNPDNVANFPMAMSERLRHIGFTRAEGLILSETGTLNIAVSAGEVYYKVNEFDLAAFDSSAADTFNTYLSDILDASAQTQWDTQNYDLAGSKTALTNNRYGTLWVYQDIEGLIAILYGTSNSVTYAGAEAEAVPTVLPANIADHGYLIGRIIFQKGAVTGEATFETAFGTTFNSLTPSEHNNLSGVQGGTAGEYYHATAAEATVLGNTSGENTGDQDLSGLATKANVLELDNTDAFTPDADYEPATKKYVDDNVPAVPVTSVNTETGAVVLTTGDIGVDADSNYVTDAQQTVIGNTSGTNTGDQSAGDFNHDDLANITGTAAQYNHPTDAQMTVIGNTSGTNTGDQVVPVDSVNSATGAVVLDTGDISEATDANYVSDAELVVIGNTSGTNTGDQTLAVSVTDQAYGDSGVTGSSTNLARQDHKHGMPAALTDATIATTDVTTNNATNAKHGWLPKLDDVTTNFLRGDGTWAAPAGGGGGLAWEVITTGQTAVAGEGYMLNPSANLTITMPASPTEGQQVGICDLYGKATTYEIEIDPNGNNIDGSPIDMKFSVDNITYIFTYSNAAIGWKVTAKGDHDGLLAASAAEIYLPFDVGIADVTAQHTPDDPNGSIITGNSKFGAGALELDSASSEYLTTPNDAALNIFRSGPTDATMGFWAYNNANGSIEVWVSQYESASLQLYIGHHSSNVVFAGLYLGGGILLNVAAGSLTAATWHHIALVRKGTNIGLYLDGNQIGWYGGFTPATITAPLRHGVSGSSTQYLDGRLDDFFIIETDYYSATPNVGLTDTLTGWNAVFDA